MKGAALSVLAAGLLVVAFFALWPGGHEARGAVDPTSVRLVLQWKPQAQFAGYYAAVEKGFYAQRGLNVTIVPGGRTWTRSPSCAPAGRTSPRRSSAAP
jgi:NitT/TauT family transport system substrate-binding protein